MRKNELFKKYYRRLALIGCAKAAITALITAFIAVFAAAIVVLILHAKLVLVLTVCGCTLAAAFVFSAPIYYFTLYRPTTATMARLIDRLGLEERIVTMCELEKDQSYIAMAQREDAKNKLSRVSAKSLKFNFSRMAIILLAVSFLLSSSMTAVSVYAATLPEKPSSSIDDHDPNHEDKGDKDDDEDLEDPDNADEEDPEAEYVTVTYLVRDEVGGYIDGETVQRIKKGEDAETVKAVAFEGYEFYAWSDDYIYSERYDWEVTEDLTVEAIFVPAENPDEGEEGEKGDGIGGNSKPGEGGMGGEGQGGMGEGNFPQQGGGYGGHGQIGGQTGEGGQPGQGGMGGFGGEGENQGNLGEGEGPEVDGGGGDGEGIGGHGEGGDGEGSEGSSGQGGESEGGQGGAGGGGQGQGGPGSGSAGDGEGQGGMGEGEPPIGDEKLDNEFITGGDAQDGGTGGMGSTGGPVEGGSKNNNSVIDGKTDYKDGMGESSKENLQDDDSIPPEIKDLIDKYLDGLDP